MFFSLRVFHFNHSSLLSPFFILSNRSYLSGIELHVPASGKICSLSLHALSLTSATRHLLSCSRCPQAHHASYCQQSSNEVNMFNQDVKLWDCEWPEVSDSLLSKAPFFYSVPFSPESLGTSHFSSTQNYPTCICSHCAGVGEKEIFLFPSILLWLI